MAKRLAIKFVGEISIPQEGYIIMSKCNNMDKLIGFREDRLSKTEKEKDLGFSNFLKCISKLNIDAGEELEILDRIRGE